MGKLKVTFLLPVLGYSGGIRVVAIYVDWLRKRGHDITLVSRAATAPSLRRRIKDLLTGKGWKIHQPNPSSYLDCVPVKHHVAPSGRALAAEDVPVGDVLVSTWWETAEWSMALPHDRGARVYFVQGHEVFDYLPRKRSEATYRLPLHKIVVARWLANLMSEHYGDSNVDLVPNAVDHEQFSAPPRVRQSSPTVGMLYHESAIKGLDVALRVVSRLMQRYPTLKVVAFGSKPPSGLFELPDFVQLHIAPAQEKLRHLYASCDVWLTTSRTEGFNLMAMEAMACRTPVVSTRTGWPVEGVRDGENGYLVDIDDEEAAVTAISSVLDLDNVTWQQMSSNAYHSVTEFTWETSCRQFEQALYRACNRARHGEIAGKVSQSFNC